MDRFVAFGLATVAVGMTEEEEAESSGLPHTGVRSTHMRLGALFGLPLLDASPNSSLWVSSP